MNTHPIRRWCLTAGRALATVALLLAAPRAAAQATPNPPDRMTYQGFLTDGNGVALGNTAPKNYDVLFRIYNHENQSAPANLLWAEQQTVTVDKGYFSVLLGEGAPTAEPRPLLSSLFKGPTASDRYVGITVKGIGPGGSNVDILPRLRLQTTPYAFLAQNAVRLVQDTGADLITSSGNAVTVGGPLTAPSFSGDGASLFSLNAANLTSGTVADARLSPNVALRNGGNTFNGSQIFNHDVHLGNFGSADHHLTITTGGTSQYRAGLRLRNFNQGNGWTMETDDVDGRLKFLSHVGNQAGTPRFELNRQSGRADFKYDVGISGANVLEFGTGVANKEVSAGKIGYGTFNAGALNVVGAGQGSAVRRVDLFDRLDVMGGLRARGGLPGLEGGNNNGYAFGGIGDNDSGMYSSASGTLQFCINAAERMQLLSWGMRLIDSADATRSVDFSRHEFGFSFWSNGKNRYGTATKELQYDGDSNWDFYSDRRLKKDIVDAEPMLDRALQLEVRRYRWKEEDETAKHKLGVIAQEVQPLFPDLVSESKGRDGNESILTVGYSDFGLVAVKALQEYKVRQDGELAGLREQSRLQQETIAAQSRELEQLKARLDRFERLLEAADAPDAARPTAQSTGTR